MGFMVLPTGGIMPMGVRRHDEYESDKNDDNKLVEIQEEKQILKFTELKKEPTFNKLVELVQYRLAQGAKKEISYRYKQEDEILNLVKKYYKELNMLCSHLTFTEAGQIFLREDNDLNALQKLFEN